MNIFEDEKMHTSEVSGILLFFYTLQDFVDIYGPATISCTLDAYKQILAKKLKIIINKIADRECPGRRPPRPHRPPQGPRARPSPPGRCGARERGRGSAGGGGGARNR